MSGAYDARWVRGPADLIDARFEGNAIVEVILNSATTTAFNLFGGSSFYLNSFTVEANAALVSSVANTVTVQLMQGPNPSSLVGAVDLLDCIIYAPSSTPAAPTSVTVAANQAIQNLNYRNRTGAASYLHAVVQSLVTGAVRIIVAGGSTALLS